MHIRPVQGNAKYRDGSVRSGSLMRMNGDKIPIHARIRRRTSTARAPWLSSHNAPGHNGSQTANRNERDTVSDGQTRTLR